jgi:hypothetical protein
MNSQAKLGTEGAVKGTRQRLQYLLTVSPAIIYYSDQGIRGLRLYIRRAHLFAVYHGLGAAGVTMPPWTRQRVPASVAVVSTTSKSWVIVAVLAIIADAEQYFSTDSAMARSTFSGATPRPFTTKCM